MLKQKETVNCGFVIYVNKNFLFQTLKLLKVKKEIWCYDNTLEASMAELWKKVLMILL